MAKATPVKKSKKVVPATYTVIRDTQEKVGFWTFEQNAQCNGTISKKLKTGDYSIVGLESIFTIERKKTVAEIAKNINEKRFENELDRMDKMSFAYIVCEFTMDDIMRWPLGSGIPKEKLQYLKVTKWFILRRLTEIQVQHNVKIIFAGIYGKEVAASLLKRIYEESLSKSKGV